jgi:glutathione S-transferase
MMESGAILIYLAGKTGKFCPSRSAASSTRCSG